MSVSQLRRLLNDEATFEDFNFIVPHPFLPPRYQRLSKERNMVLVLDRDLCLHVRWEGARMHEHHPLTPKATIRLVREVLHNMTKYRRELNVFSRFIEEFGEQPFDDPRLDPITQDKKPSPAPRRDAAGLGISTIVSISPTPHPTPNELEVELNLEAQAGGESPLGDPDGY